MKSFRDWKLSKKYLLGTGILYLLVVSLTLLYVLTIIYLNDLHLHLYRENTSSLTVLYWVVRDLYNLRILSLKHIGTETLKEMKLYEKQAEDVYERLQKNFEKLNKLLKEREHSQLFESFKKEFEMYNTQRLKEIELSQLFFKRDSFNHASKEGYESFEIAANTLKNLINRIEVEAEKSYKDFKNITNKSILLLTIFIAFLLGLFFVYFRGFSNFIIKPVESVAGSIKKITEREGWGRTISVDRKDEIGELISSFNQLSLKIRENTEEIEKKNKELQEYSSELEKLVEERTLELKKSMNQYYELWMVLNEILAISPDAIITTDTELRITGWNLSAERIFGYKEGEIKGKSLTILMEDSEREKIDEIIPFLEKKPLYSMDSFKISKDGKRIPCDFFLSLLLDQEKKKIGYVAIIKDLTQRKLFEQEILHMKKMEGIGALAAGIAHDFNNILGAIIGYTTFLKSFYSQDHPHYKYIETIEKSAVKGVNLTENLLNLYRPSPPKFEIIDLNDVVNEIILLLEKSLENISIEMYLNPEISMIEGDRSQIYHAVLNLAMNAQEAMEDGGKITLLTGEKEIKEGESKKKYVFISVKDTGCGISEEIIDKIFEPFFTTKWPGKGTGLGLTMVSNIIKRHNGFVEVFSQPENGSEFILYFPATERKEKREEEKKGELKKEKLQNLTVLIVEDDDNIRELLKEFLKTIGLKTLTASNGEEGIKIYKENMDEISIVILDIHMPIMNGFEVQKELRKLKKDLKILWVSGLVRESKIPLDENSLFLPKPFTIESLSDSLTKLIGF